MQRVFNILIRLIIVIWTIVSLFLLSFISIILYFIFKFQAWFLKRKFNHLKQTLNTNTTVYTSMNKHHNSKTETKGSNSNNNFSNIKTINRKLKIKDGEIL